MHTYRPRDLKVGLNLLDGENTMISIYQVDAHGYVPSPMFKEKKKKEKEWKRTIAIVQVNTYMKYEWSQRSTSGRQHG